MTATKSLSPEQVDRAVGALLGTVCGDTLTDTSGGWGEGVALAIPVLETLGAGLDIHNPDAQGRIVRRWIEWSLSVPESPTPSPAAEVLSRLSRNDWDGQADDTVATACIYTARTVAKQRAKRQADANSTVDCGALLGAGILAIGFLHIPDDSPLLASAARALAALTDPSEEVAETCIMWASAIRQQILTGRGCIITGLRFIEPQRASKWFQMFETAGISEELGATGAPAVKTAVPDTNSCAANMIAAWMNVSGTDRPNVKGYLDEALNMKGKYYTAATVALTGTLVGARMGGSKIPHDWKAMMHGWPGIVDDALERLVTEAIDASATGMTTHAAVGAAPGYGDAPAYDAPPYGDAPGYSAAPGYTAPPPSDAPAYFRSPTPPTGPPVYDAPPPNY